MFFVGRYEHSLDNKYILRIPARFRAEIGNEPAKIAKVENGCLVIYPAKTMQKIGQRIEEIGVTSENRLELMRFMSNIFPVDEDSQGRFTLNANLREFAGITKDIIFIGHIDRIYVWDKARWEKHDSEITDNTKLSFLDKYGI